MKRLKGIERALSFLNHPRVKRKDLLVLVDFTKPSYSKRLHVVDVKAKSYESYLVAHGSGSDPDNDGFLDYVSNVPGSFRSSCGAMVLSEPYKSSKFQYAIRLDGLEPGLNDNVRRRAVVFHSSDYVLDTEGRKPGRSQGCFAVSNNVARRLFHEIQNGVLLYAHHKSLLGVANYGIASRVMKMGDVGEDVLLLQRALLSMGYSPGPIDGKFGPMTEHAVKTLQKALGIAVDGRVGPITLSKIGPLYADSGLKKDDPDESHELLTLEAISNTYSEGSVEFYEACYRILAYDPGFEGRVEAQVLKIVNSPNYVVYEELSRALGIPSFVLGAIHCMECDNHPLGVFHNGEKIIGTNRKTSLVPKGRGPFSTLYESGIDAFESSPVFSKIKRWTVGNTLYAMERYNGLGYISGAGRAELSPYIWACTNINDDYGKYVADGRYDPRAYANGQVGCAALLKKGEELGYYTPEFST